MNQNSGSESDIKKNENIFSSKSSCRVLVVDDLPVNHIVIKGLIASYNFSVDSAYSGQEAVDMAGNNKYDIIFMDHVMPEMDGEEAAAAIRGFSGGGIPIVALTANTALGMDKYYIEHGFDDCLLKPIDKHLLENIIKKWVKADKTKNVEIAVSVKAEIEAQRIDILNHYRFSFERKSREFFNEQYFGNFTDFIRFWVYDENDEVRKNAAALLEDGQRKDAAALKQKIGVFYDLVKNETNKTTEGGIAINNILTKLRNALIKENLELAEKFMGELGSIALPPASRDIYFRLYDLLLIADMEKALEEIDKMVPALQSNL